MKFQKANGIAQVGTVGPATRAALNKGTIATAPESALGAAVVSSTSTLTASQAQSIIGLLLAFGADQSVINNVKSSLGVK